QYQIKSEPTGLINPIILGAIISIIVLLFGLLVFIWKRQANKKAPIKMVENAPNAETK
ncbi:hypothetical protein GQR86_20600, partial [Providencia vermicola]|nr:hypothetical protein [Providencia vermicola]